MKLLTALHFALLGSSVLAESAQRAQAEPSVPRIVHSRASLRRRLHIAQQHVVQAVHAPHAPLQIHRMLQQVTGQHAATGSDDHAADNNSEDSHENADDDAYNAFDSTAYGNGTQAGSQGAPDTSQRTEHSAQNSTVPGSSGTGANAASEPSDGAQQERAADALGLPVTNMTAKAAQDVAHEHDDPKNAPPHSILDALPPPDTDVPPHNVSTTGTTSTASAADDGAAAPLGLNSEHNRVSDDTLGAANGTNSGSHNDAEAFAPAGAVQTNSSDDAQHAQSEHPLYAVQPDGALAMHDAPDASENGTSAQGASTPPQNREQQTLQSNASDAPASALDGGADADAPEHPQDHPLFTIGPDGELGHRASPPAASNDSTTLGAQPNGTEAGVPERPHAAQRAHPTQGAGVAGGTAEPPTAAADASTEGTSLPAIGASQAPSAAPDAQQTDTSDSTQAGAAGDGGAADAPMGANEGLVSWPPHTGGSGGSDNHRNSGGSVGDGTAAGTGGGGGGGSSGGGGDSTGEHGNPDAMLRGGGQRGVGGGSRNGGGGGGGNHGSQVGDNATDNGGGSSGGGDNSGESSNGGSGGDGDGGNTDSSGGNSDSSGGNSNGAAAGSNLDTGNARHSRADYLKREFATGYGDRVRGGSRSHARAPPQGDMTEHHDAVLGGAAGSGSGATPDVPGDAADALPGRADGGGSADNDVAGQAVRGAGSEQQGSNAGHEQPAGDSQHDSPDDQPSTTADPAPDMSEDLPATVVDASTTQAQRKHNAASETTSQQQAADDTVVDASAKAQRAGVLLMCDATPHAHLFASNVS